MSRDRIAALLISDDIPLCGMVHEFCALCRIDVTCEHEGRRGLARALQNTSDAILLDADTPDLDALEVLHQIRRRSSVPVIILVPGSAKAVVATALDAGADDVLEKPCAAAALAARVRAIVRRHETRPPRGPLAAGDLVLSPSTRTATVDGRSLSLTSTEYDILECLVRSAGRIVSRDELAHTIGRRPVSPLERSIDVHISRIRRKLDDRGSRIRSVRGIGYVFCVEVGERGGPEVALI